MDKFEPGEVARLSYLGGGEGFATVHSQSGPSIDTTHGTFYWCKSAKAWRVDKRDRFFVDATAVLTKIEDPKIIKLPVRERARVRAKPPTGPPRQAEMFHVEQSACEGGARSTPASDRRRSKRPASSVLA